MSDNKTLPPPNIDFPTILAQLDEDAHHLDGAVKALVESLRRRNLQVSPEILQTLQGLQQTIKRARQQGGELQEQSSRLQKIVKASARITTSLELEEVLQEVMRSVIELSGAERAYLMLNEVEGEKLSIRATHQWEGSSVDDLDIEFSRSVVKDTFEKNEPVLTMNALDDTRFQSRKSIIGLSLRSVLCVPLSLDNRVIGVLYADNRMRSGVFSKETVQLLTAFGTQAAIAIEKARLHGEELRRIMLEKDLSVAREIQFSLLPKNAPAIAGWDFAASYQPARVVGGDFYDFFNVGGQQGVVIADVADKGVGAALFMSLSRTMIRTAALTGVSPSTALTDANHLIVQDSSRSNLFLSVFYCLIDPQTGHMIYTTAGHNPPYLYRAATGSFTPLPGRGIVLGVFEDIALHDLEVTLDPGDFVVFYTDGLTEAMDEHGGEFGEERLQQAVIPLVNSSAADILNGILEAIRTHTSGAVQSDDLTIMIAKRL
jgi:serine phosphatase RsbU (regulator of sigma subunit)